MACVLRRTDRHSDILCIPIYQLVPDHLGLPLDLLFLDIWESLGSGEGAGLSNLCPVAVSDYNSNQCQPTWLRDIW